MNNYLVMIMTLTCIMLVVYHHVFYPLLLKWLAKRMVFQPEKANARSFKNSKGDAQRPHVTILVPAYNEENWIADKIRNLASLDYPKKKLNVIVVCDGCTDATANIARETIQEAICADVRFEIIENRENRGKLAIINHVIPTLTCDIVALTDVSALVSLDALLVATDHFNNPKIGVVNSHYCMPSGSDSGESTYWEYQNNIS